MNIFVFVDPVNCQYIIRRNGIEDISNLLKHSDEDILLNIVAALYFIRNNVSVDEAKIIFTDSLIFKLRNLKETSGSRRVCNLITVLLEQQDVATSI